MVGCSTLGDLTGEGTVEGVVIGLFSITETTFSSSRQLFATVKEMGTGTGCYNI
jgi:hypothetical protein